MGVAAPVPLSGYMEAACIRSALQTSGCPSQGMAGVVRTSRSISSGKLGILAV